MAKDLSKILVVDLESTCTETPIPNFINEVIEIGIAVIEVKSREVVENRSIMVRPRLSTITPFCTQLTTITEDMVSVEAGAITFHEACAHLRQTYGTKIPWASYGDYDRRQFERQCQRDKAIYPFGPTHINVKTLVGLHTFSPREVGMDRALSIVGRTLQGTHHRGVDDALNIAGLLMDVLLCWDGM